MDKSLNYLITGEVDGLNNTGNYTYKMKVLISFAIKFLDKYLCVFFLIKCYLRCIGDNLGMVRREFDFSENECTKIIFLYS